MPDDAKLELEETDGPAIRELVSYRLSRTAGLMSRGAALRYRREFEVSLGEWRALALLTSTAPQSLMQLSRAAGLDKAQMSRVVASLIERGLVLRAATPGERGATDLRLSPQGGSLYARLIAAARERDQAFRAGLTAGERVALDTILDKLAAQARIFIQAESRTGSDHGGS